MPTVVLASRRFLLWLESREMGAVLMLVVLLASPRARGQTLLLSVRELLDKAAASGAWNKQYASTTDVRYRALVGDGPKRSAAGFDAVVKKYRDSDRLHIITDYIDYQSPTGQVIASASRREMVSDTSQRVGWWYPLEKPLIGSVQVAKSAQQIQRLKLIDTSDPATGCFLDGNIDGSGSIIDLMKMDIASSGASIHVRQETWNKIDCDVVESRCAARHLTAWIAPSKGYLVIKYLADSNDDSNGPATTQVEATAYRDVGAVVVVRAGHCSKTWIASDRTKWQATIDAERSALELHPTFLEPNLFTTNSIPNGTRVLFDDLPNVGVDFIWNNGAPIAKVDAELFNELGTSIQRTKAGEVAAPLALARDSADGGGVDDGNQRMAQLWLLLLGSALMLLVVLAAIYLVKRNLRVV